MTTVLDELVRAYKLLLTGAITVDAKVIPIYVDFVPNQSGLPEDYLLIQNPSSVGDESKCDLDQKANIQFFIFSRKANNDGHTVREIATQFYSIVYPDRLNNKVIIQGYQNITMQLISDRPMASMDTSNGLLQIKERVIIFQHLIS